eukprot:m.150537 g.150537  ORF g.150537 m.150537 type:complete len:221 (-) comp30731_c0_seq1:535-1197(-)
MSINSTGEADEHGYVNHKLSLNGDTEDYRDSLEEGHMLLRGRAPRRRWLSLRVLVLMCLVMAVSEIFLIFGSFSNFDYDTNSTQRLDRHAYSLSSSAIDLGIAGCIRLFLSGVEMVVARKLFKVNGAEVSRPRAKRIYGATVLSWTSIFIATATVGFCIIKFIDIALLQTDERYDKSRLILYVLCGCSVPLAWLQAWLGNLMVHRASLHLIDLDEVVVLR